VQEAKSAVFSRREVLAVTWERNVSFLAALHF
jgi:hypothetical protein